MQFGLASSADDVLQGIDLGGKRVLVTGISAGVGAETARVLLGHGAEVVGAVRNPRKAADLLKGQVDATDFARLKLVGLDLGSLQSVKACAVEVLDLSRSLDVIICNAGIMAVPQGRTVDGFEMQFGTNYLGHFALVNALANAFALPGRLVVLSSAGHRGADVSMDDPNFHQSAYDPLVAYRRSKTALVLMAVEFDRRHRHRGIRAAAVHPGAVLTETAQKLLDRQPEAASRFTWKTPAQGAATGVWAAFVADADEVGGHYCEDCHVAAVTDTPGSPDGVRSYALDPARARQLWGVTEQLIAAR